MDDVLSTVYEGGAINHLAFLIIVIVGIYIVGAIYSTLNTPWKLDILDYVLPWAIIIMGVLDTLSIVYVLIELIK